MRVEGSFSDHSDDVSDISREDASDHDGMTYPVKRLYDAVFKVLTGIRLQPETDGVSLQEIHDRYAQRYERRWDPLGSDEQDYMDAVMRAPELMFKMTSLVRNVGNSFGICVQRGYDSAVKALHLCKFYTLRHIYKCHILPMKEEVKKTKQRYESLKKQVDIARNQYLNEISVVRNESRNRPDPDYLLSKKNSDIRQWYDPTSSLTEEELSFVARVVREKLQMILEIDPNVTVSTAQVSALMKHDESNRVRELEAAKTQREHDNAHLKSIIRDLESKGSAPSKGLKVPNKKLVAMEEEMEDLREEVRFFKKESAKNEALRIEHEADTRVKQEDILQRMRDLEDELAQTQRSKDEVSVSLGLAEEEVDDLGSRVLELEEQLRSAHAAKKLDGAPVLHTDRRGSSDRRASIAKRSSLIQQHRASIAAEGPRRGSLDGFADRRSVVGMLGPDILGKRFSSNGMLNTQDCIISLPETLSTPAQPGPNCASTSTLVKNQAPQGKESDADVDSISDFSDISDSDSDQNTNRVGKTNGALRYKGGRNGSVPAKISISCEKYYAQGVRAPTAKPASVMVETSKGRLFRGSPRQLALREDHPVAPQAAPQRATSRASSKAARGVGAVASPRGDYSSLAAPTPCSSTSDSQYNDFPTSPQTVPRSATAQSSQRTATSSTNSRAHTPSAAHRNLTPSLAHTSLSKEHLRDASGRPLTREDITRLILDPRAARVFERTTELPPSPRAASSLQGRTTHASARPMTLRAHVAVESNFVDTVHDSVPSSAAGLPSVKMSATPVPAFRPHH